MRGAPASASQPPIVAAIRSARRAPRAGARRSPPVATRIARSLRVGRLGGPDFHEPGLTEAARVVRRRRAHPRCPRGIGERAVDGLEHRRGVRNDSVSGTSRQRRPAFRASAAKCLPIPANISGAAPQAVDRLLLVADREQCAPSRACRLRTRTPGPRLRRRATAAGWCPATRRRGCGRARRRACRAPTASIPRMKQVACAR